MSDDSSMTKVLQGAFPSKQAAHEAWRTFQAFASQLELAGINSDKITNVVESELTSTAGARFMTGEEILSTVIEPLIPNVGFVGDSALFYNGTVNMVFGTDSVGKSMITMALAVDEVLRGNHVLWIDFEEPNERAMHLRMQEMGLRGGDMKNFVFVALRGKPDMKTVDQLSEYAARSSMVVIDSVGEYLGSIGANENFDNEVSQWLFSHLARPLAQEGAAVVLIDHVTKTGGGGNWAAGSKRKRAGITGAAYSIDLHFEGSSPSREKSGFVVMKCAKDKHGTYARDAIVSHIEIAPLNDNLPLRVVFGEPPSEQDLQNQQNVLDALRHVANDSEEDVIDRDEVADVLNAWNKGMTKAGISEAFEMLERLGQIRCASKFKVFRESVL